MGVDNLKWIRIFVITQHISNDDMFKLLPLQTGEMSMLVNNITMGDQWVKSKQLFAALEILSV